MLLGAGAAMLLWCVASGLAGVSLGLYFGRLMAAIILNWESSSAAVRTWMTAIAFVFGGGALGSTALFRLISSPEQGAYYLCGWSVGAIITFYQPCLPARYTLESVRSIVRMSDYLREHVTDCDKRAVLIAATLFSPKSIEKDAKLSEEQFAKALEDAADAAATNDEDH